MNRVTLPVASLLVAVACTAHSPAAPSSLVSAAALIPLLEHVGARVSVAEQMPRESFPFFSVTAQRLLVNGQSVHVFEYPDADSAASDAARVAPSGSPIGSTQITWVDPPRFYMRGRLIALYVGRDEQVSSILETVLGQPFAGRR